MIVIIAVILSIPAIFMIYQNFEPYLPEEITNPVEDINDELNEGVDEINNNLPDLPEIPAPEPEPTPTPTGAGGGGGAAYVPPSTETLESTVDEQTCFGYMLAYCDAWEHSFYDLNDLPSGQLFIDLHPECNELEFFQQNPQPTADDCQNFYFVNST